MKVLIISGEVWRDDTNGGNVLSNIFRGTGFTFAQIYCNPGEPSNDLCKQYYQITDKMVLNNIVLKKEVGNEIIYDEFPAHKSTKILPKAEHENNKVYNFFRRHRWHVFYTMQSVAWNISKWNNSKLKNFIDTFDPDIIFAPCYANVFMLRLTQFVAKYTGKKVISYISDDAYSINNFSISPFYWINKLSVRHQMRKTFPYYSLTYTMTDEQKQQCENVFGARMSILRKSGNFNPDKLKQRVNNPIKFIYAGGIYLNRWVTLSKLVQSMKTINKNGTIFTLDVYTNNEITDEINSALNDGEIAKIHKAVGLDELTNIYKNSDIALHVEGLDKKNRRIVRSSFSTKIVDCLESGCAVMAICDEKQAGFAYLKRNNAAICVSNIDLLSDTLLEIAKNPSVLLSWQKKAFKLGEKYHLQEKNINMILNDFIEISGEI